MTASELTGPQKAAILLRLLGEDSAGLVRSLGEAERLHLTREVAELPPVDATITQAVLQEFVQALNGDGPVSLGGYDAARRLLSRALDDDGADALLGQLQAKRQSVVDLRTLDRADPAQLAQVLRGEHLQVLTVVLASMNPRRAAGVLERLPEELRDTVTLRIAQMREVSPELGTRVVAAVAAKVRDLVSSGGDEPTGGPQAAARILSKVDKDTSEELVAKIQEHDEELAELVSNSMFTFDKMLELDDRGVMELLKNIDNSKLAVALKGADPTIKEKFLRCMSERARTMLEEEFELMGAVRLKDVEEAQGEMVGVLKRLVGDNVVQLIEADDDV